MKFMFLPLKTGHIHSLHCASLWSRSESGTVSSNMVLSPAWEVQSKREYAHHPVRTLHHPKAEIPSLRQMRLLWAIRERRACTIPLGWDPSIGVVPGAPWRGSSSERRRHIPGAASLRAAITHLERDLHAVAEQLFAIGFQNYQSWPSRLFLLGNLGEKSLCFTISWLQSKTEGQLSEENHIFSVLPDREAWCFRVSAFVLPAC